MDTVWLNLFSLSKQNSPTMRTIKGKQNKLESRLALYMPDAGLISLINQEHLNIKKNYISLPIKGGTHHTQRTHAGN